MNATWFASTVLVLCVGCSSSSHPAAPADAGTGITDSAVTNDSAVTSDSASVTHDTGTGQGTPETGPVTDSGAGGTEAGAVSDGASGDGATPQFGQPCTGATTDETSQGSCGAGLVCGTWSGAGAGFCTQVCASAGGMTPCPSSPPGAACDLSNGAATGSVCAWSCSGPGGTCPPGLTCQAVAGGNYCQ